MDSHATATRDSSALEDHLTAPRGRGELAGAPHTGAAGGAVCGDLVRISVEVRDDRVVAAGFEASGCAAARAAGSAVVELVDGVPVLDAARITPGAIAEELGGLAPASNHAAELAADALHRALGLAARDGAVRLAAMEGRTLVAMSGGVDSAAAAQLALDAGCDVLAVTLELWSDPENDGERSCCSPQAVTGARALAHSMGLPHFTLDLRDRFRSAVVDDFLSEYASGATPNPCVRCNGLVRFDAMLELADALGAEKLATGHYARIIDDGDGPLVSPAADPAKDQSYVLARLERHELERLDFPLAGLLKPRVRELARAAGLAVADKRESQDLCFLAGTGGQDFMRRHGDERVRIAERGGDIVHIDGSIVGRHRGHHGFTVGQRRGLGIGSSEPLYVLAKDAENNRVVVGPRARLSTSSVRLGPGRLHRPGATIASVRLRYHSPAISCTLAEARGAGPHDGFELHLDREVRGAAPGQTAVLMDADDRVVGWAPIAEQAVPGV
jgi:tRNA-specific 2-thiouridylase